MAVGRSRPRTLWQRGDEPDPRRRQLARCARCGPSGSTSRCSCAAAKAPYVEDVDGNRYVDWVQSWGPLLFGHADPETLAAVRRGGRRGTTFGAPTEAEVELAAEIVDAVPSIEMVRLVSSGTEAAMSAVRLARGGDAARPRDQVRRAATTATSTRSSRAPARA